MIALSVFLRTETITSFAWSIGVMVNLRKDQDPRERHDIVCFAKCNDHRGLIARHVLY